MPKKKDQPKRPIDMTSDELAYSVFPPEAVAELKRIAAGADQSDGDDNSTYPNDSESP